MDFMHNKIFQLTAKSLGYEFSHGRKLFSNISLALHSEKIGLVGANGVGKSILAKILAGQIEPTEGDLLCDHRVLYFAQTDDPPLHSAAEYLMDLWESAPQGPEVWLPLIEGIDLEKPCAVLSGGEWTRLRLARIVAQSQGLLILDEPTNNLDQESRAFISEFVKSYQGALLLISHDRDLLNQMDAIWELSIQGLTQYGGNFAFYQEARTAEAHRYEEQLERSRKEVKKMNRLQSEKIARQEKRMRHGQQIADKGGAPKILLGTLKRKAQETQGKIHSHENQRVERSREEFQNLRLQGKTETDLRISFRQPRVPEGKFIFEAKNLNLYLTSEKRLLWESPLNLTMKGPKRWALSGPNGAGKSSFVRALLGKTFETLSVQGELRKGEIHIAHLDQNYTLLNAQESVLENVLASTQQDLVSVRNSLADFQFLKDQVHQKVGILSGGEKLKAALAKVFLSDPIPHLIILDEPTNNLDLRSLQVLEGALKSYEGALLVISHDEVFLENIGIEEVHFLKRGPPTTKT